MLAILENILVDLARLCAIFLLGALVLMAVQKYLRRLEYSKRKRDISERVRAQYERE